MEVGILNAMTGDLADVLWEVFSNYLSARGVMVIVTGYGHGDTNSIPG